jgi:hypothetical protein
MCEMTRVPEPALSTVPAASVVFVTAPTAGRSASASDGAMVQALLTDRREC